MNNLVGDAPISRLDFLSCRNVFIYLDAPLQKRILTRFHYALRRDGVLLLGKTELIPFASRVFEPVDLPRRLYRRDLRRDHAPTTEDRVAALSEPETRDEPRAPIGPDLAQFYREILQSVPTPLIATTVDGTVMFWNAAAAALWRRAERDVLGKTITALALPGLTGELLIEKTNLIRAEKSEHETIDASAGKDRAPGLRSSVLALRRPADGLVALLYVVAGADVPRGEFESSRSKLVAWTNEQRVANEDLETTNEELQSANEELQTTNEELQSTNEELETTNEELQSTNAELDATNRELGHRTDKMNLLQLYQRTIIRNLSAAAVVLDGSGRITSWNIAAERLLGLPEKEALGHSLWNLRIPSLRPGLVARIRKAFNAGRAFRGETRYRLPAGADGHATVAAIPLVENDAPLGAVILFEDRSRSR